MMQRILRWFFTDLENFDMQTKNILLIAGLIVIIIINVVIINKKRNRDQKIQTTTVMITKKIVDMGSRNLGDSVSSKFMLHNTGKHDLYISGIEPECSCTIPKYKKTATIPGDSVLVELKYNSTNMGYYQTSAKVMINVEESPIILTIRGLMKPR